MKSATILLVVVVAAAGVVRSNPVEVVEDVMITEMKTAAAEFKLCSECPIEEQCDTRLGCFKTFGPLGYLPLLPSVASDIGTEFFAYRPDAHTTEHRIDMDRPETFKVIDHSKQLVVMIHGYTESYRCEVLQNAKNTMLQVLPKTIGTVILVNWEHGCPSPNYLRAAANTQVVGAQLAHLLNELIKHHQVDPRKIYLVGFSLGAQVAGHAGKYTQEKFGWKIGRITGCDAAAPAFEGNPGSYLTHADAEYVDAIHTAMGIQVVGFESRYAHIDFYPNGGNFQPGCALDISCSHRRSVQLFEASIKARGQCQFHGHLCPDYGEFSKGHCEKWDALMGFPAIEYKNSSAVNGNGHYLDTTSNYPYCNVRRQEY